MKAIETSYGGYRFRSRLEARWAVFFDALGIEWEYEKEGFELDGGTKYLPDFYIPSLQTWIEIKPKIGEYGARPADNKWELFASELMMQESEDQVICICGAPGPVELYDDDDSYWGLLVNDNPYVWCVCPDCGAIGMQFDGRAARNKHEDNCTVDPDGKSYGYDHPLLIMAYSAARRARFEHGEFKG